MTLFTIALYTGIAAILWTVLEVFLTKTKQPFIAFLKNWIGTFFLFSATIKLVDPVGFSIKLDEYFGVFKIGFLKPFAQIISFVVLVLEFVLGVGLLFNAWKKFVYPTLIAMILFFTLLTGVSAIFNVVTDCGCFGDFLKLSPFTSFIKDIVLTVMVLIVVTQAKHFHPLLKGKLSSAVMGIATLGAFAFTMHNFFHLPIWDFRAYKVGTYIPEKMEEIEPPTYQYTYKYKSKATGEIKEFVNTFPEDLKAWEYVSKEDKLISEGIPAPIHDFSLTANDGTDLTEQILNHDKPIVLFVVADVNKAKNGGEKIKAIIEESDKNGEFGYAFLTASTNENLENYKEKLGVTGTNLSADATMIKTMIRATPGIVVLRKGTIISKYHWFDFPSPQNLKIK